MRNPNAGFAINTRVSHLFSLVVFCIFYLRCNYTDCCSSLYKHEIIYIYYNNVINIYRLKLIEHYTCCTRRVYVHITMVL